MVMVAGPQSSTLAHRVCPAQRPGQPVTSSSVICSHHRQLLMESYCTTIAQRHSYVLGVAICDRCNKDAANATLDLDISIKMASDRALCIKRSHEK